MAHEHWRRPYVGEGIDGVRRSAVIDREEADNFRPGSESWTVRILSAMSWDQQAKEMESESVDVIDLEGDGGDLP